MRRITAGGRIASTTRPGLDCWLPTRAGIRPLMDMMVSLTSPAQISIEGPSVPSKAQEAMGSSGQIQTLLPDML